MVGNAPMGLHLRPATAFAKLVRGFKCKVTLTHGDRHADGRSAFDLLGLLAPPGTELIVDGYQTKDHALKRANGRDVTFTDGQKFFLGSSGTGAPRDGRDPTELPPKKPPTER